MTVVNCIFILVLLCVCMRYMSTAAILQSKQVHSLNFDIVVVDENNTYQQQHPDAKLEPLDRTESMKGQFMYKLGERISGDQVIAQGSNKQSFPGVQNVQVLLIYPPINCTGSKITHAQIVVDQSSDAGEAFLVDGGVEQNEISILIQANNTLDFDYSATIYGY